MRNITVVVAWHRGSPRVSTNCTDPKGITLSPENPRKQALAGSSFSLPMPILSKADTKIIPIKLSLSTRTLWIILLSTMVFITSGSSWGCWQPSMSKSKKVMVVSSRESLETICTSKVFLNLMLCKWAFLAELDSPPPANPPEITWISPKGG